MKSLFATLALISVSQQHAVLISPRPWDPNPARTAPCGNANAPLSSDIVNVTVGTQYFATWRVIAGDGSGVVTGFIDPRGGTNFTVPISALAGSAPAVGSYNFGFSFPNVTCNPYCSARLSSESGWNSCFSFRAFGQGDFTIDTTPVYVCRTAQNLAFCNHMNNQRVNLQVGANINQIDAQLEAYYRQVTNNTNVMTNGDNGDCRNRLRFLLCGQQFSYCGTSAFLQPPDKCYCETTLSTCGLTESHQSLFDCSGQPKCDGATSDARILKRVSYLGSLISALVLVL